MPKRATMTLLVFAIGCGGLPSLATAQPTETTEVAAPASQIGIQFAQWVGVSGDNRGLPFIVIDKSAAAVIVFGADGQYIGETPALLGSALGDDSVPGIGDRELNAIPPEQRTTPAGRFLAGFGPAIGHRKVLWVDYGTSLALHPVVKGTRKERRRERLQSPSSTDNRITYGCINISPTFYEKVVRTLFRDASGVVYILPETKPIDAVFPTFTVQVQPGPPSLPGPSAVGAQSAAAGD